MRAPILQRGNLACRTLWVSAHPYFREGTLRAVRCWCQHTHTFEGEPYVPYVVGVSTPILQRRNLTCRTLWMSAHPYFRDGTLCAVRCGCWHTHASEGKPYVPYVVGVGTPILQRGNFPCRRLWVSAHPYFRGETLRVLRCGCQNTHTLERVPYVP